MQLIIRSVGFRYLVTHFAYSRAGTGTPGHPRIAEDEEMARELCAYLESFGAELWER